MSAPNGQTPVRRILASDSQIGGALDHEAALHRRRKKSIVSLLSEFEREIEQYVKPGHEQAIKDFKEHCRRRLNGITFLACELLRLQPGERVNDAAVDLAEQLAFDANGGQAKP